MNPSKQTANVYSPSLISTPTKPNYKIYLCYNVWDFTLEFYIWDFTLFLYNNRLNPNRLSPENLENNGYESW